MLNPIKILTELEVIRNKSLETAKDATALMNMIQGEVSASPRIQKKNRSISQAAVAKRNLQIKKKVA